VPNQEGNMSENSIPRDTDENGKVCRIVWQDTQRGVEGNGQYVLSEETARQIAEIADNMYPQIKHEVDCIDMENLQLSGLGITSRANGIG
jgi:hypothetical protein